MSNYGAIKDKADYKKGMLVLQEVSDAYVVKTPAAWSGTSGTSIDMGEIADQETSQAASTTEIENSSGVVVATEETYKGGTTATLMERDKSKIDFIANFVKGKFYLEYVYNGIVDGKNQEHFQIVKLPANYSIKSPGGAKAHKYESKRLYPSSTITITGTTLGLIETALGITIYCTGVSISASAGYCVKETTVA